MVSRDLQRRIGLALGLVAFARVATGDYGGVISAVKYFSEDNPNPETPVCLPGGELEE